MNDLKIEAKDIFTKDPNCTQWDYWSGDYYGILDAIGESLCRETLGYCQGDILALLKRESQYGFVSIGYGSCTACRASQACTTLEDFQDLVDSIVKRVQWFNTQQEAADWFKNHDWEGDYYGEESKGFVEDCLEILERA